MTAVLCHFLVRVRRFDVDGRCEQHLHDSPSCAPNFVNANNPGGQRDDDRRGQHRRRRRPQPVGPAPDIGVRRLAPAGVLLRDRTDGALRLAGRRDDRQALPHPADTSRRQHSSAGAPRSALDATTVRPTTKQRSGCRRPVLDELGGHVEHAGTKRPSRRGGGTLARLRSRPSPPVHHVPFLTDVTDVTDVIDVIDRNRFRRPSGILQTIRPRG